MISLLEHNHHQKQVHLSRILFNKILINTRTQAINSPNSNKLIKKLKNLNSKDHFQEVFKK
jgi:hypothetical protein